MKIEKIILMLFVTILFSSIVFAVVPTETGRWNFENNLSDSTGTYDAGVLVGTPRYNQKSNSRVGISSMYFGGDTGVGGSFPALNTALTYAFWIKINGTASNGRVLFRQGTSNSEQGMSVSFNSDNTLSLRGSTGGGQPVLSCIMGQGITNIWTHIVASVSASDMTFYVNGQPNCTGAGQTTVSNQALIEIGAYVTSSYVVNASVDDVRIWAGTGLDSAEALELYESYALANTTFEDLQSVAQGSQYNLSGTINNTDGLDKVGIQFFNQTSNAWQNYTFNIINPDNDLLLYHKLDDAGTHFVDSKTNNKIKIGMTYDGAGQQSDPLAPYSTYSLTMTGADWSLGNDSAAARELANGLCEMTVSFWADFKDTNSEDNILTNYGYDGAATGWQVAYNTDGNDAIRIYNQKPYEVDFLTVNLIGKKGTQVTINRNGTHYNVYINGTFTVSNAYTHTCLGNQTHAPLTIGMADPDYAPAGIYGEWDGKLDEVTLWNRSLTSDEIIDIYQSGNFTTVESNLEYVDAESATSIFVSTLIDQPSGYSSLTWRMYALDGNGATTYSDNQTLSFYAQQDVYLNNEAKDSACPINFTSDGGQLGGNCGNGSVITLGPTNDNTPSYRGEFNVSGVDNAASFVYTGTWYNFTTLISSGENYTNCTITDVDVACTQDFNVQDGDILGITAKNGNFEQNTMNESKANWFNIEIDTTGPIISNLVGSDTAPTGYVSWTCDESCNYSLAVYNDSGLTQFLDSSINSTLSLTHNASLTGFIPNSDYYINLTVWDALGNSRTNKTFSFSTAACSLTLLLDGVASSRKYELGTTANLSMSNNCAGFQNCLSIDHGGFGDDYVCNTTASWEYNLKLSDIVYTTLSNGTSSINTTNNSKVNFANYIDELSSYRFDLTGYNTTETFPYNVKLDIFLDGVNNVVYPGYMNATHVYDTSFTNGLTSEEIFFTVGETKTRYINYSTNSQHTYNNVTFQVSGFESGSFTYNYEDDFLNTSNVSITNGILSLPYDDFSVGDTISRWSGDYTVTQNVEVYGQASSSVSTGGTCVLITGSDSNNFQTAQLDMEEANQWNFLTRLENSYSTFNSCYLHSICSSSANIGIKDITTGVYTPVLSHMDLDGSTTYTIRVEKVGTNFKWYTNGAFDQNVAYDSTHAYEIYSEQNANSKARLDGFGHHFSCGATGTVRIKPLNFTGFTSLYNNGAMTWNTTKEAELITIGLPVDENITRAKLTTTSINTNGGTYSLFLSNNNGTTWESVNDDAFHVFSSTANSTLRAKINITTTDTDDPLILTNLALEIGDGTITNLKVYLVGTNNAPVFNITGKLNETNSPQTVNIAGSDIEAALIRTNPTYAMPVIFTSDSAGKLNYSGLSYSMTMAQTDITQFVNTSDEFNATITFGGLGNVLVDNLNLQYYGNKNVSINYSQLGTSVGYNMIMRYSPFNRAYPTGIKWWDFFPSSNVQNNISANGQTGTVGFWNFTANDVQHTDGVDIYARYQQDVSSTCLTNLEVVGQNNTDNSNLFVNLSLNTSQIIDNANSTTQNYGWTYASILCNSSNEAFIIPYVCLFSLCDGCYKTSDWEDDCTFLE